MSTLIPAKFGILDSIIIHSATDQEIATRKNTYKMF